ncbi:hypothetical protein SSX86_002740 [Deinandra increscens subsp. villosa]|uniref:Transposase n=1 Tax=Deinandra increscens subsp. villosa TaxID=3103831 RepID=A0AAP0DX04_9ASTR
MASSTDRKWMYEKTDSEGFLSSEYCDNVDSFLDFAFSNEAIVDTRVSRHGKTIREIKCPCYKCQNISYRDRATVQKHLYKEGFMLRYERWTEHGESSIRYVGQSSTAMELDDNDDGYKRMMLDNMYACGYTSDTLEGDVPNPEAKSFYDMLEALDEPLWEGEKATNCSKLQVAMRFLTWKSTFNVSNAAYDYNISMVNELLPEENKLPKNFYDTKKSLEKLSLPYERIDVCKNHCMLFYKHDKALTQCKYCKESRYKSGRSKVPNMVMSYMPIGPRLKRLYMSSKTAKDMTWHHDHKTTEGSMAHPSDGMAWKHFDSENPDFAKEIRNVRLGLCTDGFNPNNSNSIPYSLWPVFLTIYNLPPWMSMKDSFIEVCLIIPGGKSPGQNIDVFLRPLIDELKELYKEGIEVYDAYRKENFIMRAILLWTVSDFPAYAMLSGWSTHGRLACPYCMGDTKAFRLQAGGKSCWFDCHRRFLPRLHPFHNDRNGFLRSKKSSSGPPRYLTGWEIFEEVSNIPVVYEGVLSNPNHKEPEFGKTHNWIKKSIFWELEYWPMLLIRHNLDVMHIEKNVFENLFQTIMDTDKTKDNIKARKDVKELCNRPSLHLLSGNNNKLLKPKASYTLTKQQVNDVCTWLKQVKFPDGYASNIGRCVNVKEGGFYNFKSHDCHVFMQRLLPIVLRGMLPKQIWEAILELCTFFRVICSRVLHIEDLQKLKSHIYILLNCEELLDSVGLFDKELRDLFPSYDEATLDKMKEDEFAKWLLMHVMNVPNKEHLRGLAQGPLTYVKSHKGYFVNGYRFHTRTAYDGRVTQNSGVCVKGATYNENENDYYGLLDEILELEYHSTVGRCVVVLFRCTWFDPVRGVRVDPKTNMVDVKPTAIGCVDDPFILASQAQQVYYTSYPSKAKELKGWLAVVKTTPRGVYELAQDVIEVEDDGNAEKDNFYQETERIECTITDDLHHPISFVHEDGSLEEVEEGDFYNSDEEVDRNDEDSEDEESE